MPTARETRFSQSDSKPPTPPIKRTPVPEEEPRMIVRGRVVHMEHEDDQPPPMPVRGHNKK
jgi:hypothetical protein